VVGHEDEGVDVDGVKALCPAEGADNDLPQLVRGLEQKAALDGATGDFYQRPTRGYESQSSSHIDKKDGFGLFDLSEKGGTFSGGTFSAPFQKRVAPFHLFSTFSEDNEVSWRDHGIWEAVIMTRNRSGEIIGLVLIWAVILLSLSCGTDSGLSREQTKWRRFGGDREGLAGVIVESYGFRLVGKQETEPLVSATEGANDDPVLVEWQWEAELQNNSDRHFCLEFHLTLYDDKYSEIVTDIVSGDIAPRATVTIEHGSTMSFGDAMRIPAENRMSAEFESGMGPLTRKWRTAELRNRPLNVGGTCAEVLNET
jgi:hypothetical protein